MSESNFLKIDFQRRPSPLLRFVSAQTSRFLGSTITPLAVIAGLVFAVVAVLGTITFITTQRANALEAVVTQERQQAVALSKENTDLAGDIALILTIYRAREANGIAARNIASWLQRYPNNTHLATLTIGNGVLSDAELKGTANTVEDAIAIYRAMNWNAELTTSELGQQLTYDISPENSPLSATAGTAAQAPAAQTPTTQTAVTPTPGPTP